jgi:hypothetical protein
MLLSDHLVELARAEAIGERRILAGRRRRRLLRICLEKVSHAGRLAYFIKLGTLVDDEV